MKRLITIVIIALSLATLFPLYANAATGNLDGAGGNLGSVDGGATGGTYWNPNYCGARISVVTEGGGQVGECFDWLNSDCYGANTWHFGKNNKIHYRGVRDINDVRELDGRNADTRYTYTVNTEMPTIVLTSGSNIGKIRDYFTDLGTLRGIAARAGGCSFGSVTTADGKVLNDVIYRTGSNGKVETLCVVVEPIVGVGIPHN